MLTVVLSSLFALAQSAPATLPPTAPATPAPASPSTSPVAASPMPGEPAAVPSPLPASGGPSPVASALMSPSPTPSPTANPYAYRFVPRQPASVAPGQPQIFAVYLNAKRLRSHGPILIRVETSPSVVMVQSKSNGRGGSIPMIAPGVFAANSTLPAIPFIASGMTTDLVFIATTADGRSVTVRVPVELG